MSGLVRSEQRMGLDLTEISKKRLYFWVSHPRKTFTHVWLVSLLLVLITFIVSCIAASRLKNAGGAGINHLIFACNRFFAALAAFLLATYFFVHSLYHSIFMMTHLLTHALNLLTRSFTHSLVHSPTHLLTY